MCRGLSVVNEAGGKRSCEEVNGGFEPFVPSITPQNIARPIASYSFLLTDFRQSFDRFRNLAKLNCNRLNI